jgi:hypothetical protein
MEHRTLVRSGSAVLVALGVGHLVLLAVTSREDAAGWMKRGVWGAVPLALGEKAGEQTVGSLRNEVFFWAGVGSFAIPQILLGCLTWHLAGRGIPIPKSIAAGISAWSAAGGVLLVPSPFFVGALAGLLMFVPRLRLRRRTSSR